MKLAYQGSMRLAQATGAAAPESAPPTPFRFYDNRQKYLAFVNTCNEKSAVARRATADFSLQVLTNARYFCRLS